MKDVLVTNVAARRTRTGFTLVELMVVLVILAVLGAIVLPRFTGRTEQARITAAQTQISTFTTALKMFEVDTGRYPTTEEGLAALVQAPANIRGWNGPYLENTVPSDPWGNAYTYQCPGQHNAGGFDISSMGPAGRDGGETINNWTQH